MRRTALGTVRVLAERPVSAGVALCLLAALPAVTVLLGAVWREGGEAYTAAALLVVVVHAAAGAAGGAAYHVRRSVGIAMAVAAVVAFSGTRLLLAGLDPGGWEFGAERLLTRLSLLAVLGLSLAVMARLAVGGAMLRRARSSRLSIEGVAGVTLLVVMLALVLVPRRALPPLPDDSVALERALPQLEVEARRRPNTAHVQRQYGIALHRSGRSSEAAAVLARAALLDRFDPRTWHALGETQLALHDYSGSVASLRTAVRLDSTMGPTWRALAAALTAVHHPLPHARAEGAYRRAILLEPDDADARYQYARLLQLGRRDAEALEQIERAIAIDSTRAEFHLTACVVHKRRDRLADALPFCERARYLAPADPDVWVELGATLYLAGQLARADTAFAAAARIRPGYYDRRPEVRDLWAATRAERDDPVARAEGEGDPP